MSRDFIKTYGSLAPPNTEAEQTITGTDVGNKRALDVAIKAGSVTGTFTPSGLSIAGKVSVVVIDETQWWAFPTVPLANRNALVIQNLSGADLLLNYSNAAPATDGISVLNGYERQYDITDAIIIYVRRKSGSGAVNVVAEELS